MVQNAGDWEHRLSDSEAYQTIRNALAKASDVVYREFYVANTRESVLVFIDGLVNQSQVNQFVLRELMSLPPETVTFHRLVQQIADRELPVSSISIETDTEVCLQAILAGSCLLLLAGEVQAVIFHLAEWEHRGVGEPTTESAIIGPKEAFTETLRTNTALIRRRIQVPTLHIESLEIGMYSKTGVAIMYIADIALQDIVDEVLKRIKQIEIEAVIDTNIIREYIEDDPYSPFPQSLRTERPDTVAAYLLEGRIAVLMSGSPFALIVPVTTFTFLNSSEDNYERSYVASFTRYLRFMFAFIALLLPSVYVALTTFHQQMIPTDLLYAFASSRENVPFPTVVEVLLMELTFEALREAGIRLPKIMGPTVGVLGALVIGQSAVQAGIIAAPMVIIVSLTGVALFTIPNMSSSNTIRLLRFPIVILAGSFGFLGIGCGMLLIMIHLCKLRSFGIPYMYPWAPFEPSDLRDLALRAPHWMMNFRPKILAPHNKRKAGGVRPPLGREERRNEASS